MICRHSGYDSTPRIVGSTHPRCPWCHLKCKKPGTRWSIFKCEGCGYGDCIVAPQAKEFIEAVMQELGNEAIVAMDEAGRAEC